MKVQVKRAGGASEGIKFIHSHDLLEKLEAGEKVNSDEVGIIKTFDTEIKASEDEASVVQFAISSQDVDRDMDTISVKGWNLKSYKKNPVVLWAHNYSMLPVAKSRKVYLEDDKLKSLAEFTPQELNPFGHMVYQLIKGKFLNATSVGFRASEYEYVVEEDAKGNVIRRGIDFKKQELLEYSVVPVPANPMALVEARRMGIDTALLKGWAEELLDCYEQDEKTSLLIPKAKLEQVYKETDPKQTTVTGGTKQVATNYTCCFEAHEHTTESEAKTCIEGTTEEIIAGKAEIKVNEEGKYVMPIKGTDFVLREEYIESLKNNADVEFDVEGADVLNWLKNIGEDTTTEEAKETEEEETKATESEEEKTEEKAEGEEDKGTEVKDGTVVPFVYVHGGKCEQAPIDAPYDQAKNCENATDAEMLQMSAWAGKSETSLDGVHKTIHKFMHHDNDKDNRVVWSGVCRSMAMLMGHKGGANIPSEDRKGVYDHLAKHYEEFGKTAPEFRFVESQVLRNMPDIFTFNFDEGTVQFSEKDIEGSKGMLFVIEEGLVKAIKDEDKDGVVLNSSSGIKAAVMKISDEISTAFSLGKISDEEALEKAGKAQVVEAVGTLKGQLVYSMVAADKKVTDNKTEDSDTKLEEFEDLLSTMKHFYETRNKEPEVKSNEADDLIDETDFKEMLEQAQKKLSALISGRLD